MVRLDPGRPLADGHVWVEVVQQEQAIACDVEKDGVAPPGWPPVKRQARAGKGPAEQQKRSGVCGDYPMNAWSWAGEPCQVTVPILRRAGPTVETNSGLRASTKPGEGEREPDESKIQQVT